VYEEEELLKNELKIVDFLIPKDPPSYTMYEGARG